MRDEREISLFINSATKSLQFGAKCGTDHSTIDLEDSKRALEDSLIAIDILGDRLSFHLKDVDAFYLLLGPGTNTGIRLGLTIPRTIYAFNPEIKLFGLPTLSLYQLIDEDAVPVLSDRNGNLFIKEGETVKRIDRVDVSSLASSLTYIIEKSDEAALSELSDHKIITIDVLETMMRFQDRFSDYSACEEEFLPIYTQEI